MHYPHFPGNYSVEVRNSSNENDDRQICDLIHLPFNFAAHVANISCKPAVPMDVVMINRTNYGSLTLCDFKLKGIQKNSHCICYEMPTIFCYYTRYCFSNVWHTFIYETNKITFDGKILVLVVFKIGRLIGHAFLQPTIPIFTNMG